MTSWTDAGWRASPIVSIITTSFLFADEALDGSWNGQREREAVSLLFGALVDHVDPASALSDARQIGLEVPVPQVTVDGEAGVKKKDQVCKDAVIWPDPQVTCWDKEQAQTVPPAAVIEWKFDPGSIYDPNMDWLTAFTAEYPACVGYAVTANHPRIGLRSPVRGCLRESRTQSGYI